MEFYVQRLSEELTARGHEITVFTSSNTAKQSVAKVNGVRVFSLKQMSKIYNVPIVPSLFWRLLHEEKPDVIHAHQYPVFFSDVAAATSWLRNIPLLLHVHVVSEAKSALSGFISDRYYSTLGRHTLQTADTVVVPSLAYKTKLQKMHLNREKIQVIPYGIDTRKFQNNAKSEAFKTRYNCQGSKVILSVGRLNYQKGFQYLIKAMPSVLHQIPNVKLIIVGEGEQLSYLRQLSKSLGVSQSVIFTGAISQAEIPNAYSAADVFVLPSLFESFGISLIEAQAAGKPVIGTRTGGVPEALVDGETGLLIDPGNFEQLEVAIVQALSDKDLAWKMGQRGIKFVETRFSIHAVVNSITKNYEKLVYSSN
ncbi:MAG: glycosyltransferase family 4 protein [Candidatus Bathyarchaeota archaeon]|nr:glycosyltransferase family 4 protein [Candidatus Bathyarchaeota archaeon]